MPIKDRKTKLLLLIFLMSDFSFEQVPLTSTLMDIFDLSFNQKTKGVLSSLVKKGLLEKGEIEDSQSSYALTEAGFNELILEFPIFRFGREEWDGLWRIISYEIPEAKRHMRDRLRRSMRGWGLGPWHRSFWITPHPIISDLRDLVYGREEEQYIEAFEATHVFGDMDILVEKVWSKQELDKGYRELFAKWHHVLSQEKDNTQKFREVLYSYIKFIRDDPGLPVSLLGRDWIGFEAQNIFKEIRTILLK